MQTSRDMAMKNAYAIETDALTKYYGSFEAVRGLTMRVPTGSITGFLGQNGAGKSTTIKMLLGMMRPTRGTPAFWRAMRAMRRRASRCGSVSVLSRRTNDSTTI